MPNDTEPASSIRAIENLIAAYAELVDRGDFAGVGTLLSAATFTGSSVYAGSTKTMRGHSDG
jgi:hypothetical protein